MVKIACTIFFCVMALMSPGQTQDSIEKSQLENLYSQAIADFIQAMYQKDHVIYDTLYFGKRNNGQPDDFPDISLPASIGKTIIRLVDPAVGEQYQKEIKTRIYINMVGWVDQKNAEFILVTFSNGFEHKLDFFCDYLFDDAKNEFVLKKSRIEAVVPK